MGVFIIILILIAGMTGVCLYLFHMQEIEIKNQQKETYLATMQDFYLALSKNIEATRKYRHDLAKHIKTLEILLEKKEEQKKEVREYTASLMKQYEQLKKNAYCSDEIIDSLLRIKGEECRRKEIPFYVRMEEGRFGEIKEIDMVSLIYNLLDNALEANERIEKGPYGIWFSMGRKENSIWIEIKNCVAKKEIPDFKTRKSDKKEHGIGTKIIADIINKYNGTKEVSIKENLLVQKIILLG